MKKILFFLGSLLTAFSHAQTSGNALNFDGTNDQVVCNTVPSLFSNPAANSFTFEAWVYPSSNTFQRIIFAQPSTTNFATMGTGPGNTIYFYVIVNGITYSQATSASIPQNQWTHVACRWTAGTLTPAVFFNGALQPSIAGGSSSTGTSGLMTIGTRPGGAQYFNGSLDEIRIWSVARTECEIQAHMNSEFTVPQPTLLAYYNCNQGIPQGPNAPFTNLPDINGTYDGTLNDFALSGTTSNWTASGAVINTIGPNTISSSFSATICANETFMFGGQTLTISGNYADTITTAGGCDSIVNLNLTVLAPIGTSFNISSCDQYVFNSTLLNSSGTYYDTLPATSGCDSILTLNLTIYNSQTSTLNESACNQYTFNGTVLNNSGIYYDTLSTISGCDSIVTLNLSVINGPTAGINQAGNVLTADIFGASYQWIDCDNGFAVIAGETDQTFTAVVNGNYAVIVTENGCADTSSCFNLNNIGLEEVGDVLFIAYPNPTDGLITIQITGSSNIGSQLQLVNVYGQIVQTVNIGNNSLVPMDLSECTSGIYFLRMSGNTNGKIVKVIRS